MHSGISIFHPNLQMINCLIRPNALKDCCNTLNVQTRSCQVQVQIFKPTVPFAKGTSQSLLAFKTKLFFNCISFDFIAYFFSFNEAYLNSKPVISCLTFRKLHKRSSVENNNIFLLNWLYSKALFCFISSDIQVCSMLFCYMICIVVTTIADC